MIKDESMLMKALLCVLSLFSITSTYATFDVFTQNENNWGRYLRYNNAADLKSYLTNEMTFDQLVANSTVGLEQKLKEVLSCESLTDDEIVKKCITALNEQGVYDINFILPEYPITFYTEDIFSRRFNKALDEWMKQQGISKQVVDHFSQWSLFYLVTRFSFDLPGNEEILQELLDQLNSYDQNVLDLNKVCEIEYLAHSISPFNNTKPTVNFNKEECDKLTRKYNGWFVGLVGNEANAPFDQMLPKYQQFVKTGISKDKALEIYAYIKTRMFKTGERVSQLFTNLAWNVDSFFLSLHGKNFDLESSVNYIVNTPGLGNIGYEGINGVHYFLNNEYRVNAVEMTEAVIKDYESFVSFVKKNNLQGKFIDTNTTDEASRLEPVDVLSNLMYRSLKDKTYSELAAGTKNYLKDILQFMLGNSQRLEHPMLFLPRKKNTQPQYFCAFPDKQTEEHLGSMPLPFLGLKDQFGGVGNGGVIITPDPENPEEPQEPSTPQDSETDLVCADVNYKIKSEGRKDPPLLEPKAMVIDDGYIDIVMPYSLTDEINEEFKKLARTYFKALRFKIKITPTSDVKTLIKEELLNADVLMPAGHSLASRDLSMGTDKGELYTMTRKKRRGEKYGIRFKFFVPDKGANRISMSIDEMAEVYEKRMKLNKDPLLVFVISCYSQGNLRDWGLIYRKILDKGIKDKGQLPHVIASERGFPTSSNTDIISGIFFPTDAAFKLARGNNPSELYEFFKTRKYESIAKELYKRIGSAWLPLKEQAMENEEGSFWRDIFKKPENEYFLPVYNMSDDNRNRSLNMTGQRYRIYQEGNLVYDETF